MQVVKIQTKSSYLNNGCQDFFHTERKIKLLFEKSYRYFISVILSLWSSGFSMVTTSIMVLSSTIPN